MGLSESDWEELQEEANRCLYVGASFLEQTNYKDGIEFIEKALAINPYIENGHSLLAKGYYQKWDESRDEKDREQTKIAAKKAISINPEDKQAIQLISAISRRENFNEEVKVIKNKASILAMIVGIVVLIIFILNSRTDSTEDYSEEEQEQEIKVKDEKASVKLLLDQALQEVELEKEKIKIEEDRKRNIIKETTSLIPNNEENKKLLSEIKKQIQNKASNEIIDNLWIELQKSVMNSGHIQLIEMQMIQIEGAENRIAFSKEEYIKAVFRYNNLIKLHGHDFPSYQSIEL